MAINPQQFQDYLKTFPDLTQQKGLALFNKYKDRNPGFEILQEGPRSVQLIVPSSKGDSFYILNLSWTTTKIRGRCECLAYEDYGYCKHLVAAAHFLLDEEQPQEQMQPAQNIPAQGVAVQAPEEKHQPAGLVEKYLLHSAPGQFFQTVDRRLGYYRITKAELNKITIKNIDEAARIWDFEYRKSAKQSYFPRIAYDGRTAFSLSCTCDSLTLCDHLYAASSLIYDRFGAQYFIGFKDFDAEKKEALARIGLTPEDPEAADITFTISAWGAMQMNIPKWYWFNEGLDGRVKHFQQFLGLNAPTPKVHDPLAKPKDFVPAIVFLTATNNLPFSLELVIVNTSGTKFTRINLSNQDRWPELQAAMPSAVYNQVLRLSLPRLNAALQASGQYQSLPGAVHHMTPGTHSHRIVIDEYYHAIQELWPWLRTRPTFTTDASRFTRKEVEPVNLYPAPLKGGIRAGRSGKFLTLSVQYYEAESGHKIEGILQSAGDVLLRKGDTFYLPADEATLNLMRQLPLGFAKILAGKEEVLYTNLLPSIKSAYELELEESLQLKQISQPPIPSLHLAEEGNKHLVLIPQFSYGDRLFSYEEDPAPVLIKTATGEWQELVRDQEAERAFAESIRALHPLFEEKDNKTVFFIPFATALTDAWYQQMLAAMEARGIAVTGLDALQHFRYNPNEASVTVTSNADGSGIDWFDLNIEISFGDQQVSLKEVRRALMNGQAGVRLADGSIGLLPGSFIDQYGTLLKLGTEQKDGKLRLNKLHFTLIDTLHGALLDKDMSEEIAAKKRKLQDVEQITTTGVPEGINATLRPYQIAGYSWMQLLDELGWGGCLADDMGLGKTLQTITFLQFLKNKYPGSRHLVVCPTSLIYNWQAELDKFAPALRYHIHYGAGRVWDDALIQQADVVITTYGIVRSDLALLVKQDWRYVILDESQAIKNPEAQTTKAVQALPAHNRICLSGTPLQNNTYDLYAQFQFLNPGLLGSRDFFRKEFANPIDKHGEEGPRATLRHMLAPFMLRRTKEQVAKDLPDKTEVTLWCEMEPEQRAVYDEYRRFYRDSLLKRIDTEGMAGAGIYILEALLRMRQLCDHPALVKNEGVTTTASIKLAELRRELVENAGGKKVLVFSQFTEMLGIIAADFQQEGIRYSYLDGQTPAAKRADAVAEFQENPDIQVFLISLKAGGVGLNLTSAQYVYLVDPWWNPAVEAQAIDRTHRIGQQNKIMAYRMICKDTVEEKVMQLQARKRALAEGLVTEDAGFVKKLTRDDIAFLLE